MSRASDNPVASAPGPEGLSAAHFRALVESSEDAIFSKDQNAIITSWNPAAERLYGWTAEEAIGRPVSIIVPEDHANEEMVILDRILADETIDHYETERVSKDGGRIHISLTVSPIRVQGGEIVGASVIARDIGERVEQERRASLLQRITSDLAREVEPGQAIGVLVRDGVTALGAEAATLGLIDAGGEQVILADAVGHSE